MYNIFYIFTFLLCDAFKASNFISAPWTNKSKFPCVTHAWQLIFRAHHPNRRLLHLLIHLHCRQWFHPLLHRLRCLHPHCRLQVHVFFIHSVPRFCSLFTLIIKVGENMLYTPSMQEIFQSGLVIFSLNCYCPHFVFNICRCLHHFLWTPTIMQSFPVHICWWVSLLSFLVPCLVCNKCQNSL